MYPDDKDKYEELLLSAELAKKAKQQKAEVFDIEKSDEEYFTASKAGNAANDAKKPNEEHTATPLDGERGFNFDKKTVSGSPNIPANSGFVTKEVSQQAFKPIAPPIAPKRNTYKPNSFMDLPPDALPHTSNGIHRGSEPTIAIPKQPSENRMAEQPHSHGIDSGDGVKIYSARPKEKENFFTEYTDMPQSNTPKPAKPFKLNIADEDYNAIPDFDNRASRGKQLPVPRTPTPVQKRKTSAHKSEDEFDYVPTLKKSAVQPPVNKTMRSLGRLANGIFYTVGVLFASILLSVFILQSASDVLGLFKNDKEIAISLPDKADTKTVASILKENGLISQPLTFRLYSKYKEYDGTYLSGTFQLNSAMSYDEIMTSIRIIQDKKQVISITFIEGMSIREIAAKLEENHICDADEFIEVLQTTDFGFEFEKLIPKDGNRYLRLEGYMFPDTYNFYMGEAPKSAAKKFLVNFNKKITPDLITRIEKLNMTLDQAITFASIIQKEAGDLDDMYAVSSVFNNRLAKPKAFPLLQSDVTINYVNDNITPFVDADKQAVYAAAYNTYKCEGLPIGPISNPGVNAIKAAIYPDDTAFYYFLTDAKMHYYYAETLAKHEANMAKAKEVGDEVGGVTTHEGE